MDNTDLRYERTHTAIGQAVTERLHGAQQTFAIDYDGTYARAPALWSRFILTARAEGHRVLICTGRAFEPTGLSDQYEVHCTAGQAKRDYLRDLGIHVDVWIDDDPSSIITDGV